MTRSISVEELCRLALLDVLAERIHVDPAELDAVLKRHRQVLNELGLPPLQMFEKCAVEGVI